MKVKLLTLVRIVLLFLSVHCYQATYSIDEVSGTDVRSLALGQVKALSRELLNPAFLSFAEQKQLGISVYNRFGMSELSTKGLTAMIPNRIINAGVKFSTYGYEDYQLIQGQIALSKKLSPSLSLGINLIYLAENSILEENMHNYFSGDMGIFWQINDAFDWAFTTENLLSTAISGRPVFHTGIDYRLFSPCTVLLETAFNFQGYFQVSAGFECEIAGQFTVRAGFRNRPQTPSLGFAYTYNRWKVDTAFLLHPVLGLSSGIALNYIF
jgi:hypothetical protein